MISKNDIAGNNKQQPISSILVFLCFFLILFGFYSVLVPTIFTMGVAYTRTVTLPYRGFTLACSLVFLIITYFQGARIFTRMHFLALFIWFLYLIRIVYDGFLVKTELDRSGMDYLLQSFGICLIPAFCLSVKYSENTIKVARMGTFCSLITGGILLIGFYQDALGVVYRSAVHQGFDSFNLISPHSFSYIGLALFGISSTQLLIDDKLKQTQRTIYSFTLFASIVLMFYGASRNAILSAIIGIIVAIYFGWRVNPKGKRIRLAFIAGLIVSGIVFLANKLAAGFVLERFALLQDELRVFDYEAGSGRLIMWRNAISQFASSPLFGSGLVEKVSLYVPHNLYIEAFMATGVLGGLSVIALISLTLRHGWILSLQRPDFVWIYVLFIQKAFSGLLSTALADVLLWAPLFVIIGQRLMPERPQLFKQVPRLNFK